MINLILFGPPGSGKGTQAKFLVEKYRLTHISTGDLFRYEIGNKTPLGMKAQAFMNKGELVPDSVTIGMLENKLDQDKNPNGYILDGFPRTIAQSEALDKILKERGTEVSHLIALDVDDQEIVKRLLERGKTSGRPDDANEEVIRIRIDEYKAKTSPVYNYYDAQNKSQKVNGVGGLQEIFQRLCAAIEG
jgi:adenylate kinase